MSNRNFRALENAYDAYARNVSLNIFDGNTPVATLVDDGHGMSLDDIINKWLTVGTESKATKKIFHMKIETE